MIFQLNQKQIFKYILVLRDRIDRVQNIILDQAKNKLQNKVPVRTGFLRDSFRIDYNQLNITSKANYIWYVDRGTSKMQGRYFVQLTLQEIKKQLEMYCKKVRD